MTLPRPPDDRLEEEVLKALAEREKVGRGADAEGNGYGPEPDPWPKLRLHLKIWALVGMIGAVGTVAAGGSALLPTLVLGWLFGNGAMLLPVLCPAMDPDEDMVRWSRRRRDAKERKKARSRDSRRN